jgi:ribonuclease III
VRPAAALADRLGLPVGDLDLLEQALVHTSWLHEHPDAPVGHNERLEFLGDAVVNLAMSESLFTLHPSDDEGMLSARRASIVSTAGLARLAHRIDLGPSLYLGEGEAQRGGRRRPSILASAFEALAGALYLDLGYDRTRAWLTSLAAPELAMDAPLSVLKSPKSRLQEFTQRQTGARPEYRVVDATGPDHEKLFEVEVVVEGQRLGVGTGSSRRIAETVAAQRAIERIRTEQGERVDGPADAGGAGATPAPDVTMAGESDGAGGVGTAVMDPGTGGRTAGRPSGDRRR